MKHTNEINARFGIVPPAADDDWLRLGYDGAADAAGEPWLDWESE